MAMNGLVSVDVFTVNSTRASYDIRWMRRFSLPWSSDCVTNRFELKGLKGPLRHHHFCCGSSRDILCRQYTSAAKPRIFSVSPSMTSARIYCLVFNEAQLVRCSLK
ncbi:hypothetical protein RvY_13787 [Ramazzottius varieornatus]|uniref:Uncharacterized protein n=1 Tax=Ramazzottius varieornatus TaxID=947166 RepID=A0A1D1VP42_RAMVA|nr:hypothetical protein RvY_13787 [Ramazzottius varieornatus]